MTGRVIHVGDSCVTLELDARIDSFVNAACLSIAADLTKARHPGVRDIVTTYHTVAVHYDPLVADGDAIAAQLERIALVRPGSGVASETAHEIPVCYGDDFGPDLADVARFAGCTIEEVIRLHALPTYRVYMIGFLPGFAYLGSVDPRLAMPRHEAPRMRVAAGSVGVAGTQTGIYPIESPGGWRVIGRTWVKPFDLRRPEPSLFRPGDAVRFMPVTRAAYVEAVERGDALR